MDAITKLVLNTRMMKQAQRQLNRAKKIQERGLVNSAKAKAGSRVRTMLAGLGAYSAMRRITHGSSGADPWGEALTPVRAAIQTFVDDKMGMARVTKEARQDASRRYAFDFARTGSAVNAMAAYQTTRKIREEEEEGKNILRQDKRFTGPTFSELLEESMYGYGRLIKKSVGYIVDRIFG